MPPLPTSTPPRSQPSGGLATLAALAALPLLAAQQPALAASPLPLGSVVPFTMPEPSSIDSFDSDLGPVETFDPSGRAIDIARDLPRVWTGIYRSFTDAVPVEVELRLEDPAPMGQMVVLNGSLSVAGQVVPVQGTINAKSDQLDLLLLCDCVVAGMEAGGEFSGVQGLSLSGWVAPRLTNPGGRLDLLPVSVSAGSGAAPPAGPVRGLW